MLDRVSAIELVGLTCYAFGAFCFGGLVLLSFGRGVDRTGAALSERDGGPVRRRAEIIGGSLMGLCFVWFVVHAVLVLVEQLPDYRPWLLRTVVLVLAFAFPPLVMHVTWAEAQCGGRKLEHATWRHVLVLTYVLSFAICAASLLGFYRVLTFPFRVGPFAGISIGMLFAATGVYAIVALSRRGGGPPESGPERTSRRAMVGLFAVMTGLCGLGFAANMGWIEPGRVLNLVMTNLPLAFIFVGVWFEDRFQFFDLFVKRGLALLLTLFVLAAWFGLSLPALEALDLGRVRPWVQAIVLLPLAIALPWGYRKLSGWLDGVWLGRRYTPIEGLKAFLASLQQATNEAQLVERAAAGLSEIFRAPARVVLGDGDDEAGFEIAIEAPFGFGGNRLGRLVLGPRANHLPWFSEDKALVSSLADVFCSTLANLRLQRRERQQDERARELSLAASRSELKALRAQVNPHFLFNALNAIAGLIHRDPMRADRTVEQLAEVFRYTLRRSEHEWARLEEELEFVRAYLEVERARFGERLTFDVRSDPELAGARIPSMVVQTLVENAVKHGAAAVRGPVRIEVGALAGTSGLVIEVADSGPGFAPAHTSPPSGRSRGEGHGLANVRGRLAGHFGGAAELAIARDEQRGRTIVTLRMPRVDVPERSARAALRDPAGAA
jgi:signal transduction histidine kinase